MSSCPHPPHANLCWLQSQCEVGLSALLIPPIATGISAWYSFFQIWLPQCLKFAVRQHKYVYCKQHAYVSSEQCQLVGVLHMRKCVSSWPLGHVTSLPRSLSKRVLNSHFKLFLFFKSFWTITSSSFLFPRELQWPLILSLSESVLVCVQVTSEDSMSWPLKLAEAFRNLLGRPCPSIV